MMTTAIEGRELMVLDGGGILLHGTFHKPVVGGVRPANNSLNSLGVVFLNSLSSPRSMIAYSAVYWADGFANQGFPTFRFDLPGLGDTYGEIPNNLLGFINEGGHAAVASSKVKELVDSRGLPGVVLFGHCAGATTALYAAARGNECKGLILMDPYFNLPKSITTSLRPELVRWARRSKTGAYLRAAYDRVREYSGLRRRGRLPANANFPLIACFKKVLSKGLPILILRAHEPPPAIGDSLRASSFDYLAYVASLAVRGDQLTIKTIDDTDHSFANRTGRANVMHATTVWLRECFSESAVLPRARQKQDNQERHPLVLGAAVAERISIGE
jgi:pimeloyl-ACP methyl ester carboxylesterase